jgi:predicted nucleic acid-binding protein
LIVLDASLVIEWLVGDGDQSVPHLQEILADSEVVVPAHWPIEVSNFLCTRLDRKQITIVHLQSMLDRLDVLQVLVDSPIEIDEIGPLAIFASEYELTSYGAAYIQLAFHQTAILATLDVSMRKAAQRLSIALLPA